MSNSTMKFKLFCVDQYEDSLKKYKEVVDVIIETLNKHDCEFLNQIINHLNIVYSEFHEYNKGELIQYFTKPRSVNYKKLWKEYCSNCILGHIPEFEGQSEEEEMEE